MNDRSPALIVHVMHRLTTGGMENGVVNLINRMPEERFRHAIVSLTDTDAFRDRIARDDVTIVQLSKREGHDWDLYRRLWRTFRALQPAVVHTRNLSAVEAQLPARLAGCRATIHGEHGWDVTDPDGSNRKYQLLRRAMRPMVGHYVALSGQLERYLRECIGVSPARLTRICNGVDCERFAPLPEGGPRYGELQAFAPPGTVVIGTVGRMQNIKDQLTLVEAFIALCERRTDADRLRLVLIGEGPLRSAALARLEEAGRSAQAWLPGVRDDVPALLRGFDVFVLPSLAEGISNTLLEAMASGLASVATAVGGNPELIEPGVNGMLVPPADPNAMADAIGVYLDDPERLQTERARARRRALERYSIDAMVEAYVRLYDQVLCQSISSKTSMPTA